MPAAAFCFAGQARSLHIAPVWRSAQKHVFAVARHHRQTADLFAVLDANYTETHAVLQFLRFVNVSFLPLRKGSSQYERVGANDVVDGLELEHCAPRRLLALWGRGGH